MTIRITAVLVLALAAGSMTARPLAEGERPKGPQGAKSEKGVSAGRTSGFLGAEPRASGRVVKGLPYSGQYITETTQLLADGNRIRRKITAQVYRDGEGRTRREESLAALGALLPDGSLPQLVLISDPVAGVGYVLNPKDRTCEKTPGGRHLGPPPDAGKTADRGLPRDLGDNATSKTESLGRQTIEGLQADGTRTTVTIPAGKIGNEQPIQVVSERWYATELQVVVMQKRSDPRGGETVSRLTNVVRSEPSRSLFEIPSDYKTTEGVRPTSRERKEPQ